MRILQVGIYSESICLIYSENFFYCFYTWVLANTNKKVFEFFFNIYEENSLDIHEGEGS